jgi:hypothetical protein
MAVIAGYFLRECHQKEEERRREKREERREKAKDEQPADS